DVDTASYADATSAVTVKLWNGTGTNNLAAGDVLSNIENLVGSPHNDLLIGWDGVANRLEGGNGADYLNGLSGDDTLIGGGGADNLDGGAGADTASYEDATGRVTVKLWNGTGADNVAAGDVLSNIENLIGSSYNDLLIGSEGVANRLEGGNGADYLNGLSGDDVLFGGAGVDTLDGGAGADVLDGGDGIDTASYAAAQSGVTVKLWNGTGTNNIAAGDGLSNIENLVGSLHNDLLIGAEGVANRLEGGNGNDFLAGLTGDDTFVFRPGDDADKINDFVAGAATDDVIEFIGFGGAFDSFGEIIAISSQVGGDTVINFGGGDTITLVNVTLGNLHADDFLFA
ncbi:MAG: calcium-binding protein, partial [Amphiplicatus sp.]